VQNIDWKKKKETQREKRLLRWTWHVWTTQWTNGKIADAGLSFFQGIPAYRKPELTYNL
jgi:hypothetical protein